MATKVGKVVSIVLAVIASLVLVLVGVAALALWLQGRGKTMPQDVRERAQATMDRCSPDYPIKVARVSKHEFIGKTWYEFELRAEEDRSLKHTTSEASLESFGGYRCLKFERVELKVQRDGASGAPAAARRLPEEVDAHFHHVSFREDAQHPSPEPDFSSAAPYPYSDKVKLTLDRRTQNLGSDEALMIVEAVEAARADGATVTFLSYHMSGPTGNEQADWFDIDQSALASPTLQQDMERAKEGDPVPGIEYKRYGA